MELKITCKHENALNAATPCIKTVCYKIKLFLFFLLITSSSSAQNMRGLYVNGFNSILGNATSETTLLTYAQGNGYNYLCLYSLASLDLTSSTVKTKLASFISRAKSQYGVLQVGAAGEVYSFFSNYIIPYNQGRTVASEKFDVLNFEFEFWITATISGLYCTQYLVPAGFSCDTAGAFAYAKTQFSQIDNAAANNGMISEVYFGWPNRGQMQWFAQRADRILLHAYRTSDSDIYAYTKNRLIDIASINSIVNLMIIFSSESIFMGPWLESHPITQPYETYATAFTNETGSWKNYIKLIGYQWFKYSTMPPTTTASAVSVSANGPVNFCQGGNVVLSTTNGTSKTYQWTKNATNISGASNSTYTATATGDYAVKVTKAGSTISSSPITVTVTSAISQPVITANGPLSFCQGESVTLTSSSVSGNLWSNNATSQSITVSAAGEYQVTVSSGSCSATSAITTISTNPSSTPPVITAGGSTKICPGAGVVLTSSIAQSGGYTWSTGETTRSIIASAAGSYWVRTGSLSCYAQSANKSITMKTAPATPVISASGSTNLGEGGFVTLASSTGYKYLWVDGNTTNAITISMAGDYRVTVTKKNGCSATSASTVVTSSSCTPPPVPSITSSCHNNLLEEGNSLVLTSSPAGGYLWSNGQTTQSITVSSAGSYSVRAYNAGYCFSTSLPETVYKAGVLVRHINEPVPQPGLTSLNLYPNPAQQEFHVSFTSEKEEPCLLNIYDLSGRVVMSKNITVIAGNNIIDMNAGSFKQGIYLVRLSGETINAQLRLIVTQ